MPIAFPTDEWIKALMAELNRSEAYREAARNWEGDFCFLVKGEDGQGDTALYMDLWHGECRDAFAGPEAAARTPEFAIEAPLATWRKVLERRLDPIQGLMTRQLKLKGQLLKVMRAPRAASELVHCCTLIDTAWPETVSHVDL
jgi:putative sterol carrier protein